MKDNSPKDNHLVRTAWQLALILAMIALVVWLVAKAWVIVQPLIVAVFFALGLSPAVEWLHHFRLPRLHWQLPYALSVLMIYVLTFGLVSGILLLALPPALADLSELLDRFPTWSQNVMAAVESLEERGLLPSGTLETLLAQADPQELTRLLPGALVQILGGVFTLIWVLVFTVFMMAEGPALIDFSLRFLSQEQQEQVRAVLDTSGRRMRHWLLGQIAAAAILGTLTALAMAAFMMPYPILWGIAAFIISLIPLIGAAAVGIPAIIVAIQLEIWQAIAVASFFVLLWILETNVVGPRILGRLLRVSPFLVIISFLSASAIMGVWGALIAVPAAASIKITVTELVLPWLESTRKQREE